MKFAAWLAVPALLLAGGVLGAFMVLDWLDEQKCLCHGRRCE